MTNCPFCGKLTDPRLDNCVHCGGALRKAPPGQMRAEPQKDSATQTCPNCHALVQAGDIICVVCGTNLLTGQKISAEQPKAAPRRSRRPLLYAGVGVLAAVLLVGLSVGLYILLRDPIDYAVQLSAQGRNSEAVAALESYLVKKPNSARGQFELGKMFWSSGQYPRAAQAFAKASDLAPKNRDAALLHAASLSAQNSPKTLSEEVTVFERVVAEFPDDAQGWRLLALARGASGDYAGMSEALNQARTLDPDAPELGAILGVGDALSRKYSDAIEALTASLKDKADNPDALAALGVVKLLEGNADDAEARLNAVMDTKTSVRTLVGTQLGLMMLEKGDYKKAIEYLEKVRNQPDADASAQFFYACALLGMKFYPDAAGEFEKLATASGPFAKEAAVKLAQTNLERGELDKARAALEQATTLGASGAELETLRGRIMLRGGDENGAQSAFKKATSIDPNYAAAHLENGLLYIGRQAMEEGIQELDAYLALVASDGGDREVEMLVSQLKTASGTQAATEKQPAPTDEALQAPPEGTAPPPSAPPGDTTAGATLTRGDLVLGNVVRGDM